MVQARALNDIASHDEKFSPDPFFIHFLSLLGESMFISSFLYLRLADFSLFSKTSGGQVLRYSKGNIIY